MNDLVVKMFEGQQIRIQDRDGNPWFSIKDICKVLGIENYKNWAKRLREKEKSKVHTVDPITGSARSITVTNESGLYKIIFSSRKAEAERFRDWVFEDVLPSIRKTGKYEISPVPTLMTPERGLDLIRNTVSLVRDELGGLNDRDRIILKDHAINLTTLALSGKESVQSEEYRHVTISARVLELGHQKAATDSTLLQKIGKKAAQLYRQKYKEDPPRHDQLVHGATRKVFTYFRKDLDLVDQAVSHFLGGGKVVSIREQKLVVPSPKEQEL